MGNFNDEHSGKGGSYVVDKDGNRVLQERTAVAAPTAQETPAASQEAASTKVRGAGNAKSN
jgi:hypothetical protein